MERFRNKLSNLEAEEIEIINLIEMVQNSSIPNKYNLSEYLCKGSDQGVLAMEKDDIFLLLTIWEKNQSIVEDVSFLINHSRNQSMFMSEMPEFIENPQESFHIPHLENGIEVELDHSIISSEKAKPKFNTSIFSPRKPKDSPSFSASQKFRFQQAKGFFSSAEDPNLSGSSAGSLAKSKDYPFRLDEIDSPDLLLDTSRPNMMNTPARVADNDSASPFGVPLQNNSPFRKADRLELASDNERTPIDLKSIISEKKIGFFDSVPLRMDQEQNASNLISLSPMNPSPGDGNPLSAARSAESGSDVAESPIRSRSSAVQRNSPLILHAGISKLSKAPLNPVRERPVAPSPLRNNLEPLKELEPLERISIDADNSFVNSINKTESPSKYKKQVETLEETLAQFGERISELENQNEVLVLDNQSMRKQTVELKSKCSSLSTQNIVYEMDISKLKAELTQLQSTGTGHYGQLKDEHILLLSKTESIEIQKLEITEQVKLLEESIKLKDHKLVSNESHIAKLETDQTAQHEEILKLQNEVNECNAQLQEKNRAIENSTSNFETLRLQFNESAALNLALKKQLEEALSENERLLNLSNEFEKEKDFETAMKPELKDAETQSDLLRFDQFEHSEAKEFINPGNERMQLLSTCVTLDQQCQTESPELDMGAVKFVYIQPDQKQTFQNQADEIVDVKAFDLSAVAKDNNSLCFSTNDPDFDNNVNNENIEFFERLDALDVLVSKYEIENNALKGMLEQYQSETLQIRHEMSLGKQREKEIERWFQNVRKTQANNNIEITKAKMDYEKRRHQRINKKVQELEASRKRTENEVPLEKLEDTKKVEPRISHVSLEKQKVSHFQIESNQHGLVDIKSLNLVNEPTANETRNFDENREKALEGDHSIPDVLPQEPETLPNPISSGISVTLETITQTTPSLVDRDKSSSIRYIMVLTLAVTIAFSFIQPRFFKIILSLATEDDSYVVAI